MPELCVAHLVRQKNDPVAFRSFLESYVRYPAGELHDLLIIFKGFSAPARMEAYDAMLQGIAHRRVFVGDSGFDIGSYRAAARAVPHQRFVFLNSFSRILQSGWLETMCRHARRKGVGIVGATASHQSILGDLMEMRRQSRRWLLAAHRNLRYFMSVRGRFPPFPNPHVRTNAFLISRDVLDGLRVDTARTKWDAYRFESGSHGLTRQVLSAGLLPLVVGRDGRAFAPEDWPDARTFWIADQSNLLVEDNQTRAYSDGDVSTRERLSYNAWRRWPDGRLRLDPPPAYG